MTDIAIIAKGLTGKHQQAAIAEFIRSGKYLEAVIKDSREDAERAYAAYIASLEANP